MADADAVISDPAYTPPMPGGGRVKAPASAQAADESPKFPRSTPEEKAKFESGFGGKSRATPKPRRATKSQRLEEKLEELFSALALPFLLAGDTHCANIVAQGAPKMAAAWVALADENPGVARVLNKLTETSAWGGVILSTASVAIPIAAHHGAPMGPLGSLFGGGSSSAPAGANGAPPSAASPVQGGSAMGAPTFVREPPVGTSQDGFVPRDPRAPADSPPGVVTVGTRNKATASGANGMAAVS